MTFVKLLIYETQGTGRAAVASTGKVVKQAAGIAPQSRQNSPLKATSSAMDLALATWDVLQFFHFCQLSAMEGFLFL